VTVKNEGDKVMQRKLRLKYKINDNGRVHFKIVVQTHRCGFFNGDPASAPKTYTFCYDLNKEEEISESVYNNRGGGMYTSIHSSSYPEVQSPYRLAVQGSNKDMDTTKLSMTKEAFFGNLVPTVVAYNLKWSKNSTLDPEDVLEEVKDLE
jgi:hypothetical protein